MTQANDQEVKQRIQKVREIARRNLSRFAKSQPEECKEVYLFEKDHFCGIRFVLGSFRSTWRLNDSSIEILNGDQSIMSIEIDGSATASKAA